MYRELTFLQGGAQGQSCWLVHCWLWNILSIAKISNSTSNSPAFSPVVLWVGIIATLQLLIITLKLDEVYIELTSGTDSCLGIYAVAIHQKLNKKHIYMCNSLCNDECDDNALLVEGSAKCDDDALLVEGRAKCDNGALLVEGRANIVFVRNQVIAYAHETYYLSAYSSATKWGAETNRNVAQRFGLLGNSHLSTDTNEALRAHLCYYPRLKTIVRVILRSNLRECLQASMCIYIWSSHHVVLCTSLNVSIKYFLWDLNTYCFGFSRHLWMFYSVEKIWSLLLHLMLKTFYAG